MVNYTEESENLYNNQMYRKYNTINSIEKSFEEIGLDQHLSPNRRNGFFAMVERIRALSNN